MKEITGVTDVTTAPKSVAVTQETLALVQTQMYRYVLAALGKNSPATEDYKALQYAVQTGNLSDAQSALARLNRDSNIAASAALPPVTIAPAQTGGEQVGTKIDLKA